MERATRDSLPLSIFIVAEKILPQLTRTGRLRQLTTNVGGIFSSCVPYTLDNDIKPPVCTLVLSRGGRFQEGTRDSLSLPTFIAASELFLLITHDIGVILRRWSKTFCVFTASCIPVHRTTTGSLRRARLYRVMEPDRSMTRARFLALADIYLLIGEEAFFSGLSHESGVIAMIDHQRWR